MAMKSSSVCALEPEKITKTKWAQYYGTPCIIQQYFVVTNVNAASSPSADPAAGSRWGLMQRNSALTRLDAPLCATIYHMPGVHSL